MSAPGLHLFIWPPGSGLRRSLVNQGDDILHFPYLAEFDFRYNQRIALGVDDGMRACKALEGIKGRRLTYRRGVRPG